MSVGNAELHKAIATAWGEQGLTTEFQREWTSEERSRFTAFNDTEASPESPFPYCVFEVGDGLTAMRMSGVTKQNKYYIKDIPVTFRIFSKGTKRNTAKEYAAELADFVLRVFGGHPTVLPVTLELDVSSVLLFQYQTDYSQRLDDELWSWVIEYLARVDSPVRVE